jgi:hypothetical protein
LLAFKNSFVIHVLQGRGFCAEFIMLEFLLLPPTASIRLTDDSRYMGGGRRLPSRFKGKFKKNSNHTLWHMNEDNRENSPWDICVEE